MNHHDVPDEPGIKGKTYGQQSFSYAASHEKFQVLIFLKID